MKREKVKDFVICDLSSYFGQRSNYFLKHRKNDVRFKMKTSRLWKGTTTIFLVTKDPFSFVEILKFRLLRL